VARAELRWAGEDSAPEEPEQVLDTGRLWLYLGSLASQFTLMCSALYFLQLVGDFLGGFSVFTPAVEKACVALYFLFIALRSRIYSVVLPAPRPKKGDASSPEMIVKRPWWTPPRIAFPFIWCTIAVLRSASSTMVWEACGRDLVVGPLFMMMLHLSIGDLWNYVSAAAPRGWARDRTDPLTKINNKEKLMGVSVPGVFVVVAGVYTTTAVYFKTLPAAGWVLLPSCVWLTVACCLVTT